jgi:CelD/BcsL family acetyltransferase involved in cellulose biosynthesis
MSEAAVAEMPPQATVLSARNTSALRPSLKAEVIEGANAYDILAADWRRIAELQSGPLLFQTPELLAAWARHFPEQRPATIVVREGSRPVLIWPLAIERRMLFRIVRSAGAPIGQYDDILLDPHVDGEATLATAFDALMEKLRPDLLILERVRSDSSLRAALHDATPICQEEAAPFVDLSAGAEQALAALKPTVAKKQRKRVRRFFRQGNVNFTIADDPAEAEAWLAAALALKRDWLKDSGRISRAFVKAETGNCLAELARARPKDGAAPRMVVSKLSLDGRAAAFEAGFRHGRTFYLYLRAFAPELATFGPGNVLTQQMLGWCAASGIDRYDMMAPRSRNKSEWQSGEVTVFDFALPMTRGGRFYLNAVVKSLEPAVRNAFYALPESFRSAVAGVALRM